MDIYDQKKRSEIMSKIRSKNTKPEMVVRKMLFAAGYRYRLHSNKLPGHPDIVLPKYGTVIFVHGCFWHKHAGCKNSCLPKSNSDFWQKKLEANVERDKKSQINLSESGWRSVVIWECQTENQSNLRDLISVIFS